MTRGVFHRLRIFDFARREHTLEKALAKPLDGMFDPRVLDEINPDAEHTHSRQKTIWKPGNQI
jgi:hypothetical protein